MPGYLTKDQSVAIPGEANLLIQSLLDKQQFSDPLGEAAALGISSAVWPLFGQLWPSSIELAAWIALRPVTPDERILEVGCGLGLASLVAHRNGADVTASDCHPLTEKFLQHNAAQNDMSPITYRHGNWGDDEDTPERPGHPAVQGRYDVIMGSDVLYERDEDGKLFSFIDLHSKPHSEVLIVDPNRANRSAFNKRMFQAGFSLEETNLNHAANDEQAAYNGRLLHYRR